MKIGVIGVGHLGQHHVKHLAAMPGIDFQGVYDTNATQADAIARRFGVRVMSSMEEVEERCEAVTIAVPTPYHFAVAERLLNKGLHCLVEKPLTTTVEEAEKLIEIAEKKGLILQVGHIERFNPAVVEMAKHVKNPAFIEVNRLGPYDPRVSHVGVVLDLMIHDIDIILSMMDQPIERLDAVGGKVISGHEDIVKATLYFKGGCRADLSASRVTLRQYRKIRIYQPDAYISLDYSEKSLKIYRRKGPVFKSLTDIKVIRPRLEKYDALQRELAHFVHCAKTGTPPLVAGEHGRNALELASEILRSMRVLDAPMLEGAGGAPVE